MDLIRDVYNWITGTIQQHLADDDILGVVIYISTIAATMLFVIGSITIPFINSYGESGLLKSEFESSKYSSHNELMKDIRRHFLDAYEKKEIVFCAEVKVDQNLVKYCDYGYRSNPILEHDEFEFTNYEEYVKEFEEKVRPTFIQEQEKRKVDFCARARVLIKSEGFGWGYGLICDIYNYKNTYVKLRWYETKKAIVLVLAIYLPAIFATIFAMAIGPDGFRRLRDLFLGLY